GVCAGFPRAERGAVPDSGGGVAGTGRQPARDPCALRGQCRVGDGVWARCPWSAASARPSSLRNKCREAGGDGGEPREHGEAGGGSGAFRQPSSSQSKIYNVKLGVVKITDNPQQPPTQSRPKNTPESTTSNSPPCCRTKAGRSAPSVARHRAVRAAHDSDGSGPADSAARRNRPAQACR